MLNKRVLVTDRDGNMEMLYKNELVNLESLDEFNEMVVEDYSEDIVVEYDENIRIESRIFDLDPIPF